MRTLIFSAIAASSLLASSAFACMSDYEAWQNCEDPQQIQVYINSICNQVPTSSFSPVARKSVPVKACAAGQTAYQCCVQGMQARATETRNNCLSHKKGLCASDNASSNDGGSR